MLCARMYEVKPAEVPKNARGMSQAARFSLDDIGTMTGLIEELPSGLILLEGGDGSNELRIQIIVTINY
jgi:hypothetical protein